METLARKQEQHDPLQRDLSAFIASEINPLIPQWEAQGIFPAHDLFGKMGRAGFLGLDKSPEYGGRGLDLAHSIVMAETLGAEVACNAICMAIGIQTDMTTTALDRYGTEDLKRAFLAPSIAGELVACLGISETGAGSDVASIRTTARRDGAEYVIDGGKMWTTNGTQADWMCLLANTGPGTGHRNKSLFCVPLDLPGVDRRTRLSKLGAHASDTAQVFFDGVRIPVGNLIGEEGKGFVYQMQQFEKERLWAVARGVGQCRTLVALAAERLASGRDGSRAAHEAHQRTDFRLAELASDVEATRALLYAGVSGAMAGSDVASIASMAKLRVGRLMRRVPAFCLEVFGDEALSEGHRIGRMYRDMRLGSIGGGADEVMMTIISRKLGLAK